MKDNIAKSYPQKNNVLVLAQIKVSVISQLELAFVMKDLKEISVKVISFFI